MLVVCCVCELDDRSSGGVLPSVVCRTECGREAEIMRRPCPTEGCCDMGGGGGHA